MRRLYFVILCGFFRHCIFFFCSVVAVGRSSAVHVVHTTDSRGCTTIVMFCLRGRAVQVSCSVLFNSVCMVGCPVLCMCDPPNPFARDQMHRHSRLRISMGFYCAPSPTMPSSRGRACLCAQGNPREFPVPITPLTSACFHVEGPCSTPPQVCRCASRVGRAE